MKKIEFLAFGLMLVLSISGCSTDNTQSQISNTEETEALFDQPTDENTAHTTKQECMTGCEAMWKANESNAGRSNEDMNTDCENLCNSSLGIENQDVALCAQSEGTLKDICYSGIAESTKDATVCEKITDQTLLSTCYIGVVEKTKDATICEKIPEGMFKSMCMDSAQ